MYGMVKIIERLIETQLQVCDVKVSSSYLPENHPVTSKPELPVHTYALKHQRRHRLPFTIKMCNLQITLWHLQARFQAKNALSGTTWRSCEKFRFIHISWVTTWRLIMIVLIPSGNRAQLWAAELLRGQYILSGLLVGQSNSFVNLLHSSSSNIGLRGTVLRPFL